MKTTYYKKGDCSFGDCKNSYSRYKYKNGDIYEGQMTNGQPDIYGCMLFKDGSLYVGNWSEGKANGYGLLFDQISNKVYNTIFKNDELLDAEEKLFGFTDAKNNQAKANIDELLNLLPKTAKIEKNLKVIKKNLSKYEN